MCVCVPKGKWNKGRLGVGGSISLIYEPHKRLENTQFLWQKKYRKKKKGMVDKEERNQWEVVNCWISSVWVSVITLNCELPYQLRDCQLVSEVVNVFACKSNSDFWLLTLLFQENATTYHPSLKLRLRILYRKVRRTLWYTMHGSSAESTLRAHALDHPITNPPPSGMWAVR